MSVTSLSDNQGQLEKEPNAPPHGTKRRDSISSKHPFEHPAGLDSVSPNSIFQQPTVQGVEEQDAEILGSIPSGRPPYTIFTKRQKIFIIFMVAWAGFFSPLSSSVYFPVLNTLATADNVSNELINLTITTYMVFQGLAPTVFGDLADMIGRRPTYLLCLVIYFCANLGLALQSSYPALLTLRMLQSTGSSGTIAIGTGVVADVATSSERGVWMGAALMGPMVGPAIAPVIGGVLSQFLGWRSIFWFLVIMAGIYIVVCAIVYPETGRNVVGNGSIPPQGWNMSIMNYLHVRKEKKLEKRGQLNRTPSREEKRLAQAELAKKRKFRLPNPLKAIHIIAEKDISIILGYNALIFAALYDLTATIPSQFAYIYHYNDLQIGLCYIPFGFACIAAAIINGRVQDWHWKKTALAHGITVDRKRGDDLTTFPIEKARIGMTWPFLIIGLITYLCYGWVLDRQAPLPAPLILQTIIGYCFVSNSNTLSTMLVDLYPESPATATAANNMCRCLLGAGATAVIQLMIKSMGVGWAFTFIALVCLASMPVLLVVIKHGPRWRKERRLRKTRHEAEKEEYQHEKEERKHAKEERKHKIEKT